MFPRLGPFHTSNVLLALSLLFVLVATPIALRGELRLRDSIGITLLTALSALLGGRLFHVVWERPAYFMRHPGEIFTRLDGMTLYGALLAAMAVFAFLLSRRPERVRARAWDAAAIEAGILIGILRISCFAEGCCWGAPTALPWAVRYYDPGSTMPWLGIPVHPVQLYESFAGFAIAWALWRLGRRLPALSGLLIFVFCILYSGVRFALEGFRGDSYRGVDLMAGLSTSQLISVALAAVSTAVLAARLVRRSRPALGDARALGGVS